MRHITAIVIATFAYVAFQTVPQLAPLAGMSSTAEAAKKAKRKKKRIRVARLRTRTSNRVRSAKRLNRKKKIRKAKLGPRKTGRQARPFNLKYKPGTIVIINSERKLYYVTEPGRAVVYGVAVGKKTEIWTGKHVVTQMRKNPTWRHPNGGRVVRGGPGNPLGVRALYLGWSLWRIHGTPARGSIGQAVSNGCIRMRNEDVTDLYKRVHIGAPVYVLNTPADAGKDLGWGRKLVYRARRVAKR